MHAGVPGLRRQSRRFSLNVAVDGAARVPRMGRACTGERRQERLGTGVCRRRHRAGRPAVRRPVAVPSHLAPFVPPEFHDALEQPLQRALPPGARVPPEGLTVLAGILPANESSSATVNLMGVFS